jgi:hypothetical protein
MILAIAAFISGHFAYAHASPAPGMVTAVAGIVVASLTSRYLLRDGIFDIRWMRTESKNLIAARDEAPKVWLVAHLDSKSQTIPMLTRVASVVLSSIMYLLLIVALMSGAGEAALVASYLTAIALFPLMICIIGNTSPGALDNASGVVAVLEAAGRLPRSAGVVITSGEELGLAGARVFARSHAANIALNCDTIDDRGQFILMHSGRSGNAVTALMQAGEKAGVVVRARRMIPGILADHIAFRQSGWDSCTLSRGNLGTLRAVHTSGDRNDSIDGTAIAKAADILVAAAEELT